MLTTAIPGLTWMTGTDFGGSGSRQTTIRHNSDERKFHKSRTRRGIRFRKRAIQLCCRSSRRCCLETSSARASFLIEKPNGEICKVTLTNGGVLKTENTIISIII